MSLCKCSDCGLLGRYSTIHRELLEVDIVNRKTWQVSDRIDPFPVCSAQAFDLHLEWIQSDTMKTENPLMKERDCPKFYKHNPGFSPKEHKEMIAEERLENMRKGQRESDLRFLSEQRKYDRIFQRGTVLVSVLLGALITVGVGFVNKYLGISNNSPNSTTVTSDSLVPK